MDITERATVKNNSMERAAIMYVNTERATITNNSMQVAAAMYIIA